MTLIENARTRAVVMPSSPTRRPTSHAVPSSEPGARSSSARAGAGLGDAARRAPPRPHRVVKTVALDQVDGFVAIDAKGNVTVFSGKVDIGTGSAWR